MSGQAGQQKRDDGPKRLSDAQKSALNFITRYLSAKDAEYLKTGKYTVEYLKYDWSLNEQEK